MLRPRTTGWEAFRHGRSDKQKKPIPPIFNKDKRKYLVHTLFAAMQNWRHSPFQFEGRTRAHIRSVLCASGYGWHRADAEATYLLSEVLKGYKRPSWNEGQPSHTASVTVCKGCNGPLDDYEIDHGIRYCSAECQRIGKQKTTGLSAGFIEIGPTKCANPACRAVFFPRDGHQQFCCHECSVEGRGLVLPVRDCATCGEQFQPTHETSLYCSDACSQKAKTRRKGERRAEIRSNRRCAHCDEFFTPKSALGKYCSVRCQKNASYSRLKAAKAAATNPDSAIGKLFDKAA